MFALENAAKRYPGTLALAPTSLSIPPGRITVIIGPSGSGKSTLLRLLIGLITPDEGVVRFDGRAVTAGNVAELRRKMGFVVQEGGLFPHMSAERNVSLMARQAAWKPQRIRERVTALAELTHFPAEALMRYPRQLSGGQRQRVSLMRALMLDPEVLLLDEPLGALDPMIRFDLQNDLKTIFQSLGKTVIVVTHDLSEAAFFGDGLVLMREGRVVQQGSLDDLIERPAQSFVTRFINAQRTPLAAIQAASR